MDESEKELFKFLRPKLRQASYMWKPRNQALSNSRVSRGKYKCEHCNEIFARSEIAIDHIEPVVPLKGDWDIKTYIMRMFVDVDGYQVLCKPCHKIKTDKENKVRKSHKKK